MAKKEALVLHVETIEGISTKTDKAYKFNSYYVFVNGIKLQLKPVDNTVAQVLEQYHNTEE
jgi:hypothetical protein